MSTPGGERDSRGDPMRDRSRKTPVRFKVMLVMVGLAGTLVAAELTLQVVAVVAGQLMVRDAGEVTAEGEITILSVGDSHTFGLPLPREDSYPAQLEVALATRHPELNFGVVNLGIPGLNSAFVANRLERQMFQLRPQLVIVWVGVNNMWNVAETLGWERPDRWLPLRKALLNFKLFRFASIVWFGQTGHQYNADARGGWFEGELPPQGHLEEGKKLKDPTGSLGPDLERMASLAHALETPIAFVTYPMDGATEINRTILATGGALGVAVIDTSASLERSLEAGHLRPELIDERAGPHPSRLLYGYIVEDMVPEVEAALSAWHGIDFEASRASAGGRSPGPAN